MNPNEDAVIAAADTQTPIQSTGCVPSSRSMHTPPTPTRAPLNRMGDGRSCTTSHAISASATGDDAMTAAATLVGSSWAAW